MSKNESECPGDAELEALRRLSWQVTDLALACAEEVRPSLMAKAFTRALAAACPVDPPGLRADLPQMKLKHTIMDEPGGQIIELTGFNIALWPVRPGKTYIRVQAGLWGEDGETVEEEFVMDKETAVYLRDHINRLLQEMSAASQPGQ
jgi:hypothetical protein